MVGMTSSRVKWICFVLISVEFETMGGDRVREIGFGSVNLGTS